MAWPDIIPFIRYEDPAAMIDWLRRAFGFEKHLAYEDGGKIVHAEVVYRSGTFIGPTGEGDPLLGRRSRGTHLELRDLPAGVSRE